MIKTLGLLPFLLLFTFAARAAQVEKLRCGYANNPVGIDDPKPELSWILTSTQRSEHQTAYRILVASSSESLAQDKGDLWDSGKVVSDQTLYLPYGGSALSSQAQCFWKVQAWDKAGQPSAWSAPATWTMGLLQPQDWTAKWITAKWFTPPAYRPAGFVSASGLAWADVDLGAPLPVETIRLMPGDPAHFPKRFTISCSDDMTFHQPRTLVDHDQADYALQRTGTQEFPIPAGTSARFIRLSVQGKGSTVRQMEVLSGGKNVALMKFTREYGTNWRTGHAYFLVDGMPSQTEGDACPPDACSTPAAPLFRKAFSLSKSVQRATLYVAALGMADVTLNGKKVGDEVMGPPFSDYSKRVYYVTHDITQLLVSGENVLGVTLGNGYFNPPTGGDDERMSGDGPPRLLVQAEIDFTDGTRQTLATDESWKWIPGEVTFNDLWNNYTEDRRLVPPGWDGAGYADTAWHPALPANPPAGRLIAPMVPPTRLLGENKPARVEGDHAFFDVVDGSWPSLKIDGHAGQTVTFSSSGRHSWFHPVEFTLATDGPAVLSPHFMVTLVPDDLQIDGLTAPLTADALTSQIVGADLPVTGAFECSNPFFNQLYSAVYRTEQNYVIDVPADPTREKQGWTQDEQNMFPTASYLNDVRGLYRRWWWDMADNQDETGYLGSIVPLVNQQQYDWNSPWWSGVVVLLPWEHYQQYGDRRVLAEGYETMRRYVDFLGKMAERGKSPTWDEYPYPLAETSPNADGMLRWNGAGDWENPYKKNHKTKPNEAEPKAGLIVDMSAWHLYATIVSQTAALLDKSDDAAKYAALATDIQTRVNTKLFHPETGLYGDATNDQTSEVLPLACGLAPADKQDLTYRRLIDAIHARQDHIGCGFVGLTYLLQTLAAHRESALANRMVNQTTFPTWRTLMKNGVLMEEWNGGGAPMPSCGGSVGVWFYQSVLGIQPDPTGPGFAKFILAPQLDPATGLTWAKGYYDSVHGKIVSDWKWENGQFTFHAVVPANTTATIDLPTDDPHSVQEGGQLVASSPDIKVAGGEEGIVVLQAGSGDYTFTSAWNPSSPSAESSASAK